MRAGDLAEVHGRCGWRFAALTGGGGPGTMAGLHPLPAMGRAALVHHLLGLLGRRPERLPPAS